MINDTHMSEKRATQVLKVPREYLREHHNDMHIRVFRHRYGEWKYNATDVLCAAKSGIRTPLCERTYRPCLWPDCIQIGTGSWGLCFCPKHKKSVALILGRGYDKNEHTGAN